VRPVSADISAVSVARRLITDEQARGVKRLEARATIARQAGLMPGTLENLERGRLKFADRVAGRLHELLVRKIERRIAELQAELAAIAAVSRHIPDADVLAAAAAVDHARRLLGKE
jgi:predicted nucleic acid-binding protein